MNNVSPGDLAKIVGDHARVGMLVEVVDFATAADYRDLLGMDPDFGQVGVVWRCRLMQGAPGVVMATCNKTYLLPGDDAFIADCYLKRIPPAADPDAMPAPRVELGLAA